ncbi:MAG: DUF3006 family protein [Gemmatimonadota bacterium]
MGVEVSGSVERFVVDRREGLILVVEDSGGAFQDVPAQEVPSDCRVEGAVLDVPMSFGSPAWGSARRNRAEERRRVTDLTKRMEQLKKRDPGGDVEL